MTIGTDTDSKALQIAAGTGGNGDAVTGATAPPPSHFIKNIIEEDLRHGKNQGKVITRFPPEPNGYLHIGHAKSICLNFGLARDYQGRCHLRFDDTNPTKEEVEYVESIKEDVRWLGFDWANHLYYASDYFEQLYECAVQLIKEDNAYVCDLTPEEIREYRGTLTEPGRESPYRNRSVKENLDLLERMRKGEFAEGSRVLRAKIDVASGNLNMRDPVIYRILHASHHRTDDRWCIYPMYDFAHCISDSIEGITHSICTLEFEDHRALYDWFLDKLRTPCHPRQIEFARLNLSYTVMSKRKLLKLVNDGHVSGWNDPRMPTISGIRRRGYPPAAIRNFCERIGVAKRDSTVDMELLEFNVRDELNRAAPRAMGILNPLKVIITNFPENGAEELEAANHPDNPAMGARSIFFTREIFIEREDFMEDPPKKFYRLSPGKEVRLRYGYLITCQEVEKDPSTGDVIALHCTYDPATRGGNAPDGRKVKATIHWLSTLHSVPAEIRLYDRLFSVADPDRGKEGPDFRTFLNPGSMEIRRGMVEKSLRHAEAGAIFQFERLGYFCIDSQDSRTENLVFNRTVTLRDTWAKVARQGE